MTYTVVLGISNVLLFIAYYLAERHFSFYSSLAHSRTLLYIAAIPVSIIFSERALKETLRSARDPSLWDCTFASLRILALQTFVIFTIYFFLKDTALSRAFIIGYLSLSLVLNLILIFSLPALITGLFFHNSAQVRAILYGFGKLPIELQDYIRHAATMGITFLGYYADDRLNLNGIEWLGTTRNLLDYEGGRKQLRAELVFAYCDDAACNESFREGIELCTRRGARVHLYSNISSMIMEPVRIVVDGKMVFLTFFDEPLQNPINQLLKRIFDIVVSLPVVLLVMPLLTMLVWLFQQIQSPGPIFFKQVRYGINRRPFTILKYRTMHPQEHKQESRQATKGDLRIYPFGRFLRKTSLDEFPQFINALRGEMSIVGPRPHLTLHDQAFEKFYMKYRSRHYVKPGITGLAQVSGYRGETRDEAAVVGRVERDLRYIRGWTFGLEVYIVLKTAWQILFPPKTAY